MEVKDKLQLLEIILKNAVSKEWYTEDLIYCYNELYNALTK